MLGLSGVEILYVLVALLLVGAPVLALTVIIRNAAHVDAAPRPPVMAGWYDDPARRHEQRYWDGRDWTSIVSDGSVRSQDPLQPLSEQRRR